ncbi:hypothetical protein THTE_1568 [Thermogutta terrifontis]|uniref:Uncharacterized protein n=1 Tax=Thermogutta terrifontis TaxID=1331910 RepID=A0A286RDY6_9BACT|nr:hypothetical protein THTE_1568 [Thermogutta terrifontis]
MALAKDDCTYFREAKRTEDVTKLTGTAGCRVFDGFTGAGIR